MSSRALWNATRKVRRALEPMRFAPPVACVYDPLDYAARSHKAYVDRYGAGPKEVLLLGMNPGPFGMVQTGVPFGEVALVRDWMGIEEKVDRPVHEHPKRPILGFECGRSEVSGRRLWGYFRDRFGTPEAFFERFWVHNYCPLAFLEDTGRNRTPDKLPAAEKAALFGACDAFLRDVVRILEPRLLVGIGAFAEACLRRVAADEDGDGRPIGRIPHPSPASPVANKGWDALADRAFADLGIAIP